MSSSELFWGLLFGSIGLGYLMYGRRQKAVVPLVCGIALIAFPYFVSSTILLVSIGAGLVVIPYFIRI